MGKASKAVYSALGTLLTAPFSVGLGATAYAAKLGIKAAPTVVKQAAKESINLGMIGSAAVYGGTKGLMKTGTTLTWDAINGSSKIINNSFKMRQGSYAENFMRGNIIPMKLKAPVGVVAVGGIVGYNVNEGINQNEEETNMRSSTIDHMEATGDIVLNSFKNR